jgi:hypothetical protein
VAGQHVQEVEAAQLGHRGQLLGDLQGRPQAKGSMRDPGWDRLGPDATALAARWRKNTNALPVPRGVHFLAGPHRPGRLTECQL